MKKREKKYHWRKKYLKSGLLKFQELTWEMLVEYGIAGSKCYLDENNEVRVRPLTIDECFEMQDKLPLDGITIVKTEE